MTRRLAALLLPLALMAVVAASDSVLTQATNRHAELGSSPSKRHAELGSASTKRHAELGSSPSKRHAELVSASTPPADRPASTALIAGLAGQFRRVIANAIWVKADAYHHEFIKTNPHWTENRELLPIMRAVTALDPNFTQAYSSAAWMMALGEKRSGPAKAFLKEGIRNNPECADLYETMAIISWRCDRDLASSLASLKQARKYAPSKWDADRLDRSIRKISEQLRDRPPSSRSS